MGEKKWGWEWAGKRGRGIEVGKAAENIQEGKDCKST